MKKKIFALGLSATMLLSLVGGVFAAKPNFTIKDVIPSDGRATVVIPEHAVEVTPNIFHLGSALDVDGRAVEGYAIIHRKDNFAKPPWAGGGKKEPKCYSFLAKGAKWRVPENYLVDPTNSEGLSPAFVSSTVASDLGKWESAAGVDILGGEIAGPVDGADTLSPDGNNEVMFGDVDSEGAIAVTIVWGFFGGRPSARELVEWDQVYDDVDFDWSSTGESGKMDFSNIAQHELGHSVGMGHPDDSCTEETMYRFAGFGETKKRTLEAGDIAGISKLYQ